MLCIPFVEHYLINSMIIIAIIYFYFYIIYYLLSIIYYLLAIQKMCNHTRLWFDQKFILYPLDLITQFLLSFFKNEDSTWPSPPSEAMGLAVVATRKLDCDLAKSHGTLSQGLLQFFTSS